MMKDGASINDVMDLLDKHGVEYSVYTVLSDLEKFIIKAKAQERALQNAVDYGSSSWEDWLYDQASIALNEKCLSL